ncbi:MAG: hypothetical protein ACOVSW_12985, partial [Candidatus Kapaibacteriota bacterium]
MLNNTAPSALKMQQKNTTTPRQAKPKNGAYHKKYMTYKPHKTSYNASCSMKKKQRGRKDGMKSDTLH